MRRIINQINVSITTNRTCTLRCDHCYIAPHLFDDKSQMKEETFRLIFDRVEELFELDNNLEEIEWEAIGGETTMMPFEWWDRQLPWSLDRIANINKRLKSPGSLNFLTNLVYKDPRYTDLFNKYADHPAFCLYTSWEPDTNRFGKRNQLFNKFYKTLCSINAPQKILDIILTKDVIELGAEKILEMFVPAGITDFSMKMISPYGSGKSFFEPNMTDFESMTQFFRDMKRLKPNGVTFTPEEEMLSSLMRGTSFQCNGNFKYDLSIEPDGSCHFNANQTADEAALGFRILKIEDPKWAAKLCFENKTEENNKLSLSHPECDQCEFMSYCNAGWYHYKVASPELINPYRERECSGYKEFWKDTTNYLGNQVVNRSALIHRSEVRNELGRSKKSSEVEFQPESSLPQVYNEYFRMIESASGVEIDDHIKFGKNILERIWFYDDLGIRVKIANEVMSTSTYIDKIIEHYAYGNFNNLLIPDDFILSYIKSNRSVLSRRLSHALRELSGGYLGGLESDLIFDARNEELFRFSVKMIERKGLKVESASTHKYIIKLLENINLEGGLNADI